MIKLENVGKIYSTHDNVGVGIRKVNLELRIGEFVAITGESGSGKSTLLNILSGIDTYEEGEMYIAGQETSYFSVDELENYRNKYIGFVFQNYNIIDSYTVLQNVEDALLFLNIPKKERREMATELIEKVGLIDRINYKASKLSGGEKQRVVIARALAKNPPIIAADEPTGNLDSKSSKEIIDLLHELSKDKLVLIVTHDFEEVEQYATRVLRIYDGEIKEDRVLRNDVVLSDVPNLFDEKREKIKTKELVEFSLSDLLASPKRAFFYFIVIFIMSIFCLLSIGVYRSMAQEYSYGTSFVNNQDKRRILVNKKNKQPFSESEIDEIKKLSNVDFVDQTDILLDNSIWIQYDTPNDYTYLICYPMSIDYLNSADIAYGRMPENENEIVVTASKDYFNRDCKDYGDYIANNVNVSGFYRYPMDDNSSFNVVGVINGDKLETGTSNYIYFFNSKYEGIKNYEILGNIKISYSVLNNEKILINFATKSVYDNIIGYYKSSSEIDESQITYGNKPLDTNEIVITINDNDLNDTFKSYNDYLNQKITMYYNSWTLEDYKVVGIIVDNNTSDVNYKKYIYFDDNGYNLLDYYYGSKYYDDQIYATEIKCDPKLKDNEYICNIVGIVNFRMYDLYREILNTDNAVFLHNNNSSYSNALYLSTNNYNKYIDEINKVYQISIYLKNGSTINQDIMKRILEQKEYNYVIPSQESDDESPISIVILGASMFVTVSFLFVTVLIVYLILSLSIKSRKDDIEILRTIGAKENEIKKTFTLEFSFLGVISYIVLIILYFVMKSTTSGEFLSTLQSLTFVDFVLLFLIILSLNFILSLMFSRKMFKKTIKKTLDQR